MATRIDRDSGIWLAGLALFASLVGLLAGAEPKLALAAAIAAGFVLLVFVNLATGLALFGFFSFLELLELGSAISVGKLGGVLLALGWLGVLATRYDARRDFIAVHPWMSSVLVLFLGWSLVSTGWAIDSGAAIGNTGRLFLNAILFLIVFTAIGTQRQLMLVTGGFLAGAVAACVYGLLNLSSSVDAGRLTSAGLDPNELATVLVAGIALSAGLAVNLRRSPGLRLAVIGAGVFCLLGLFLTASRGGLLALGAMVIAALLVGGRWRLRVIAAAALIATSAFIYFSAFAPPEARERISTATQGESRVKDGRSTIWTVGWRMVEGNPITGVGSGNFQSATKQYLLQPGVLTRSDQILVSAPKVAHNTYLGVLAELGVIGLALFLTLIGFSLWSALQAATRWRQRGDREGEALARSFAVALIGVLVADFFISQELNKQLWLLLGVGPALLAISQRAADK